MANTTPDPRIPTYSVQFEPVGGLRVVTATYDSAEDAREAVRKVARLCADELDRREGRKTATTAIYADSAQVFVLGKCVAWVRIIGGWR